MLDLVRASPARHPPPQLGALDELLDAGQLADMGNAACFEGSLAERVRTRSRARGAAAPGSSAKPSRLEAARTFYDLLVLSNRGFVALRQERVARQVGGVGKGGVSVLARPRLLAGP